LLKSRLEAAGIEACIPEEYTPHIFWNLIPSPLESVTVRVAAKDYKAAKALADEGGEQEQTTDPLGTSPTKTETLSESKAPEPQKEPETEPTDGKRCVACGALMPAEAVYCPKCDRTQPPTA
jgi:hypothetical protein